MRNRGLILVATQVVKGKRVHGAKELKLSFKNKTGSRVGGIVYGRHSYEVLKACKQSRGDVVFQVQIIEGLDEEKIVETGIALNESTWT